MGEKWTSLLRAGCGRNSRACKDGSFWLANVRPGTSVLRAYADGIWGEFSRAGVTVKAGVGVDLSEIIWKPDRAGSTLWQIGLPDRSAAEFRNGDRYWESP